MTDRLSIAVGDCQTSALVYAADADRRIGATLVLAHGAGTGQQSPFIVNFAKGLSARGVDVLTFNFLYTEQHRRVPDRPDALEACYRAVIDAARAYAPFAGNRVFIGGKSMGGRIASHLAASGDATAAVISGLVLLGYPLHPPGKPEQLRVAHLPDIRVPVLAVQGERDPFGSPEALRPYFARTAGPVSLHPIENGDHSLAQSRSAASRDKGYSQIQDTVSSWIAEHLA